jgi:hypothetical protein
MPVLIAFDVVALRLPGDASIRLVLDDDVLHDVVAELLVVHAPEELVAMASRVPPSSEPRSMAEPSILRWRLGVARSRKTACAGAWILLVTATGSTRSALICAPLWGRICGDACGAQDRGHPNVYRVCAKVPFA